MAPESATLFSLKIQPDAPEGTSKIFVVCNGVTKAVARLLMGQAMRMLGICEAGEKLSTTSMKLRKQTVTINGRSALPLPPSTSVDQAILVVQKMIALHSGYEDGQLRGPTFHAQDTIKQ